jgi:sarcosine oxidase subunit alpha
MPTNVSLAAAALRRGVSALARSFRMHRPRGAFCHAGWCQQCRVTLSDGRVVLACRIDAEGGAAIVAPRRVARIAGWLGERVPPWFYEHRFLRPRRLRQFYLDKLRRWSAAPEAPLSLPIASVTAEDVACDCLVVGGGVAGLTAATAAARQGRSVVLIEADRLGGRTRWSESAASVLQQQIAAARAAGVDCREDLACVALYADPDRALCAGTRGNVVVRYTSIVIATGAYDRLPTVPGNDLPGIIGARAFERLVAQRALPARARIGVYGHAADITRVMVAANEHGCTIAWIAGPGDLPEGAATRHPNAALVRVWGGDRARGIVIEPGGRLGCDLLVIAISQPTYELQAQLGHAPQLAGHPAVLSTRVAANDRVQVVGEAAAIDFPAAASPANERAHDDAFLCLCEDVRVRDARAAIADGYRDVELLKRHTGAGTGPCQGKLCHAAIACCLAEAGVEVRLPTMRPFVRPMPLAFYAGRDDD